METLTAGWEKMYLGEWIQVQGESYERMEDYIVQ